MYSAPVFQLLTRWSLSGLLKRMSVRCWYGSSCMTASGDEIGRQVSGCVTALCVSNALCDWKNIFDFVEQSVCVHLYRFILLHRVWSSRCRELL